MRSFPSSGLRASKVTPRARNQRLMLEPLEERTVLSLSVAGNEFLVNTQTVDNQQYVKVAMDNSGNFIAVWHGYGQDGSSGGIFAQRFNALGAKVGGEFRVNQTTANNQFNPAVAMDPDGDFVVAWSSVNQDGSEDGVYARVYDENGAAVTNEFRVNTYTSGDQNDPAVAIDPNGNFIITWTSGDYFSGQDGSLFGVYAQRYNAAGTKVGGEFRVNSTTSNAQGFASVAVDSDGDFVVTWSSFDQDGSDGGVYFQRYNSSGTKVGGETRANQVTSGSQFLSKIGMADNGDYVITWVSENQDGSGNGIYARRYNADGSAKGNEFRVNTYTTNHQFLPTIDVNPSGAFIVTWSSLGQDGSGYGVYAQAYNADGTTKGGEFRTNQATAGNQLFSTVAMDAAGNAVIAWSSAGQDGSGYGNYARRYVNGLPPVPNAGGPYVISEGQSLVLDASGSSDPDGNPMTFSWDLNQDGIFGDATGVNPTVTWAQLTALGINDGPTFWNVKVRATDSTGLSADSANASLTVNNTPPVASMVGFTTLVRGQEKTYYLFADDPADIDDSFPFTFDIDWNGDGFVDQTVVALSGVAVPHVFTDSGTFNVRVTARDRNLGVSSPFVLPVTVAPWLVQPDDVNPSLNNLVVGGDMGDDFIVIAPGWALGANNPDQFIIANLGRELPPEIANNVTNKIIVYGQGGNDFLSAHLIVFNIPAGINIPVELYGGDGDDILIGGEAGDALFGGAGNDILVGGGGLSDLVNTLFGGSGNDILIGSFGQDFFHGGLGDDLIVAGAMNVYASGDALQAIRDEWTSGGSYASRVAHISGTPGGLNGTYYLEPGVNVYDDGAVDTLFGEGDQDWFIYEFSNDIASDVTGGEITTDFT